MSDKLLDAAKYLRHEAHRVMSCLDEEDEGLVEQAVTTVDIAIRATEERQATCTHCATVVRGSNVPGVYGSYTEEVPYSDPYCRRCGKELGHD